MHASHYGRLLVMTVLSFLSMYVLMYAMVDRFGNVYPNVNQFYMAGMMTAPMVLIEVLLMAAMFKNRAVNIGILTVSAVVLIGFFATIRMQTAVGDVQFLRSMIPHHASAILMCERASVQNAEIRKLCEDIVKGQQAEIDQMKALLQALRG